MMGIEKTKLIKTPYQVERERKEDALLAEYDELIAVKGQKATAVNALLMNKYAIRSTSTLYAMLRRAKSRREVKNENA